MDNWDPLDLQGTATSEIVSAAKKREIKNILKSYVGFFDPFCELIQNALDAVDLRSAQPNQPNYKKHISVDVNLHTNTLTVTDNGIGFSEAQFRTFLSPSISFKNTKTTRGNKGVGATYLAYGFNSLQIATKTHGWSANTQILNGRAWVDDDEATFARPTVRTALMESAELKDIDQGSCFSLKFEGNVSPKSLNWIGATTAEQWKYLLLVKTPLGQILEPDKVSDTTFTLSVTDSNLQRTEILNQACEYVFPNAVIKACVRVNDILAEQTNLLSQQKDASKLPPKFKKLNAVYDFWDNAELAKFVTSEEDQELVKKFGIWAYGFFCYSAVHVFDKFNDETAKLRKGQRVIRGGLQLATNAMPQGELITIPLTSNIGYQNQAHVEVAPVV